MASTDLSAGKTLSRPLVLRVKRAADDEPLDVIRLRHLGKKFAKIDNGFSLENVQFQRTGTISDVEDIANRTADLTFTNPPNTTVNVPAADVTPVVSDNNPSTKVIESVKAGEKPRVLKISRKFRPVEPADGLNDITANFNSLGKTPSDLLAGTVRNSKRLAEDDHDYGIPPARENIAFTLCDLEMCPSEILSSKRRRDEHAHNSGSGITCNDEELVVVEGLEKPRFVYDVYTFRTTKSDEDANLYDQIVSSLEDVDMVLGTASENDLWNDPWFPSEDCVEEVVGQVDDEDSNDEMNYRNEYPDAGSGKSDDDDLGAYSESGSQKRTRGIQQEFRRRRGKLADEEELEDTEEDE